MAHPHMRKRGTVQKITDRVFDEVEIPACPLRYSQFPQPLELQAGFLGEHNREILKAQLGYGDERIAALEAAGVLAAKRI